MMGSTGSFRMSARWLIPLFLVIFAVTALAMRYSGQLDALDRDVTTQEIRRLRERLNADQSHLDEIRGTGNTLLQRRIVTALALHEGLTHAYLINADRQLLASLSRSDVGRSIDDLPDTDMAGLKAMADSDPTAPLTVVRVPDAPLLLAQAPAQGGLQLLAQVDLSRPLAIGKASTQVQMVREAVLLLGAAALLAALLHVFWVRRARRLAQALTLMGQGHLRTRTGLNGSDELALIGSAADNMAKQLQTHQAQIQRLSALVNRSPMVVLEWRNEAGWPLVYASETVAQWGYTPDELSDGSLNFANLMHPEDLERVAQEVLGFIAHGPDQYRQEYRIRHKDGSWVWVDDRTSLDRDDLGEVRSISGILLDITAQKVAEQAQIKQAAQLEMFFALPFLGMAISSPHDKRWLQVNDKLCEILGYSREALLGMSWAEMTPPGDLERNVALFDELVAGQRDHYHMEKRFVRSDGDLVFTEIDVRASRDERGAVTQLFATIQDVTQRKRADEALRHNEQQLREAQRIGHMGSWERWLESNEATWSEEMYRIYEVDPEAFKPSVDSLMELVHEEDRERVADSIQRAMQREERFETSFRIRVTGGRIKHLSARAELERIDGRPFRFSGTVLDVTEQTETRSALRVSESLLSESQRVAHLGHVSIDLPSQRVIWSPELYRLLGFDPSTNAASVEAFLQVVHPDDRDRVQATVRRAMSQPTDPDFHIDHRVVVNGAVRHLETRGNVLFNAQSQPIRLHSTSLDITERKLAELALQDYQQMLEHAEELVQLGSWALDAGTGRLTISAQLFRNVGLEPADQSPTDAEYLGRIHPDDRSMVAEDMQRIRAGRPTSDLVFRTDPAVGPLRWLRRTVRLISADNAGNGTRYIGTLLDITDAVENQNRLKRVNEELERRVDQRTEQLSEANRELEAFSYTVSHDLKAPLRGIDGYSQLLQEECGPQLSEDGHQFVQRIRQGVEQMGELIADLLAYSRMERCDMTATPIALRPMIEEIVNGYCADIEQQGASIELSVGATTLPLDREGIAVVLRNLIGNALKFSRGNPVPRIEIGDRAEAGRRILWVRDNGVGFDMAYHDRIFNIFQRLHRTEDFPGTGVGLALVAKAVQRMGGRVWADSSPGAGATFFLEFPE
jgi:PAS domain S-box-containing protein